MSLAVSDIRMRSISSPVILPFLIQVHQHNLTVNTMNKEKRSLSRNLEEENSPPNRKKVTLSDAPDDAVGLLLLLSRHPCNPDSSGRKNGQLSHLGAFDCHRGHRRSISNRESIRRVVRFAPNARPRVVSHVSDDEDGSEQSVSVHVEQYKSNESTKRTANKIQNGGSSNLSLFAMALAPPPRLPNVEFGTIVGGKSRD